MAKYSKEFKLMLINEYNKGKISCESLARKHGVTHASIIRVWIASYLHLGEKGIERKNKKSIFSFQFKLDVLEYKKRTGSSCLETANRFGLNYPSTYS